MDKIEEVVRVDGMFVHQALERHAVAVEIILLHHARGFGIHTQQVADIAPHFDIDLREQIAPRRIQRVVEIEDPRIDMAKTVHGLRS